MRLTTVCVAVGFLLVRRALRIGALPVFQAERAPGHAGQIAESLCRDAPSRNALPWMGEGEVSDLPQHRGGSPSPSWHPWFSRSPEAPQVVLPRPPPPPFSLRVNIGRRRAHIAPRSESWTAVQIATPIAAGLTVAALATVLFCCYRHRHRRPTSSGPAGMPRRPKGPPNPYPGLVRARLNAPSFLYGLLPGTQSVRSRDGLRDPNWQIDEGDEEGESLRMNGHAHQPSASSSTSVPLSVATSPYFNPQIEEEDEAEEQDHGYFPAPMHGRSTSASDSALLLRPERKNHSKSLWDRLVKYTDGLRKSPSYRSGRVRPLGAVQRSSRNLDDVPGEMLPPSSKSVPGWSASSRSLARPGMVAPSTTTLPPPPARTYSADHDAYDAHDALARAVEPDESVLLISKLPGQDFFIDDATTEHSAPLR